MESNWVHGLTGKFHNHRPYTMKRGFNSSLTRALPPIPSGSASTNSQVPRINNDRPPLPQLSIKKNLMNTTTMKSSTLPPPPHLFIHEDSLSNQLMNIMTPEIEIKDEPDSDEDYLD